MMNRYAPLALIVVLGSCSSTEPEILEPEPLPEPPGTVTFAYQGAVMSGSYNVVGTRDPANKFDPNGVWAVGSRGTGTLWILGHQPVSGKGVYMFQANDIPNRLGPSAVVGNVVMFVDDPASPRSCGIGSGTVTVTSLTEKRVAGTFSGIGMCIPPGGLNSFEMINGSFDVPLVAP